MLDSRPRTLSPGSSTASGVLTDAAAVLVVLLPLAVVAGLLWALLVHPLQIEGGLTETTVARQFDIDGWYVVLAAVAGAAAGLALTLWRTRDPVATVLLLVAGAALAAWAMAATGAVASDLEVTAFAAYFVWPIAALFGAVVVLWARRGSHPGE